MVARFMAAAGVKSKAQLAKALGAPDDLGKVALSIVGDSVSLKLTGGDGG